ncbi:zinc finger dihydrouridine synthase [Russula earlei]|uniref:Zinc finger dihydrouridine synthase n=1 Tax=Russula earlei TaxID=71964 RepID=A0ACC0UQX9_9AGAM|nr:zinc finger dihydrouridine synthase [Russula earlei]
MSESALHPSGTAPVKAEFVQPVIPPFDTRNFEAPRSMMLRRRKELNALRKNGISRTTMLRKKPRLSGAEKRKFTKEEKKAQRGSNKGRRWAKVRDEVELCWRFAGSGKCDFGSECAKPRDISFPSPSMLGDEPPFVSFPTATEGTQESERPSVEAPIRCPVFESTGFCRIGLKCRFLGGHVRKAEDGTVSSVEDEERKRVALAATTELNFISPTTLKLLRTKKCPTPISDGYLQGLQAAVGDKDGGQDFVDMQGVVPIATPDEGAALSAKGSPTSEPTQSHSVSSVAQPRAIKWPSSEAEAQADLPDVPFKFPEKRRLHWADKTCTFQPFRRLCVSLGADITCGEMGLANSFLSGSKEEWSLVRRHPSETLFGVQVAGSKPAMLVPTAEVIARECGGGIDFVDLNCGCPIDLVFRTGSGSALLDAAGKLGKILVGMNRALGEIPLTIKMRTGVKEGRNTAHKLMPRIAAEWNVAAMTLHGRTRQQRYSKLADWEYIRECVDAVRAREADEDLPRIPIFGGGDAFSAQDYWTKVEGSGVDGVMIARGALIKPWIFTEIKERREWDISSRERLELVRKYAEFGLDHFGTDTAGVNTTRRYLCEALSFQYRYVPIGLLECLPPRINDRAPLFCGRDELETLLASGDSRDWVKISEIFLGPAPESWTFTPKHKSNAHGSEEGQG